jgi:rhamnose transport system ATP-binding protein
VVLQMDVASNASVASLARFSRRGLIDHAAERRSAKQFVERLHIRTPSVRTAVGTLSGGNQQKVALARWLCTSPSVLVLDEPTQGIDVGAKAQIHTLMQDLAAEGLAVLMISSELPEILGMSDRIGVMHGGTVRAILPRADATPDALLALALGR